MSVQAIAWAIEQQEVQEPETQLILMCLANYAGADGANAFPSIQRLVRDSRLSERSVRRNLRKLETMALIRRGNQAIAAAHIQRADRRPTVYDLVIPRGATQTPRESTGGHREQNGGPLTTLTGGPAGPRSFLRSEGEPKSAITRDQKEEFKARVRLNALASTLSQSKRLGDGKR